MTTPVASSLTIQIKADGNDNTQQTAFDFLVKNTGSSALTNISTRIYYTTDGSNASSAYVLEKYYDQSGAATIAAPVLASGNVYYFVVNFGTASLPAGGSWEFHTNLHLSNWANTYDGSNDWYHSGYAVGALPTAYTNTSYIPGYISGTRVWGTQP